MRWQGPIGDFNRKLWWFQWRNGSDLAVLATDLLGLPQPSFCLALALLLVGFRRQRNCGRAAFAPLAKCPAAAAAIGLFLCHCLEATPLAHRSFVRRQRKTAAMLGKAAGVGKPRGLPAVALAVFALSLMGFAGCRRRRVRSQVGCIPPSLASACGRQGTLTRCWCCCRGRGRGRGWCWCCCRGRGRGWCCCCCRGRGWGRGWGWGLGLGLVVPRALMLPPGGAAVVLRTFHEVRPRRRVGNEGRVRHRNEFLRRNWFSCSSGLGLLALAPPQGHQRMCTCPDSIGQPPARAYSGK